MAIYSADELERSRDALIKLYRIQGGYSSVDALDPRLVEARLQTFIMSGISANELAVWIEGESRKARERVKLPPISGVDEIKWPLPRT